MRGSSAYEDSDTDDETEPGVLGSSVETDAIGDVAPSAPPSPSPHGSRRAPPGIAIGQRIDGRYVIDRLLGRGAMGEVFLAHDQRLGRQVAIKLVRAGSPASARRMQIRLEREALALAKVAHPNVVGVHDVGSHDGQTYLTMQFVAGVTLREWLKPRHPHSRPRNLILDVLLQAGRGLAAAHSVGVVHRDFKPDNVIVGDDGVVRVLDFGLAAAIGADVTREPSSSQSGTIEVETPTAADSDPEPTLPADSGSSVAQTHGSASERMTQTGALLGTMAYMSSEQLEGRDADARSDQFAFCVAMWEALTGTRPFTSGGVLELLLSIQQGPRGGNGLPRWLRPILVRGLSSDPRRRWPSIAELLVAIERARTRGRRLALGLGLPATLVAAVLLGTSLAPQQSAVVDSCTPFVAEIDARWSDERRAAITTHAHTDPDAGAYVIATLDALASDWKQTAASLCDGPSVPADHVPAQACMLNWLAGFDTTVELLAERGDAKTLSHAPDLLATLRGPTSVNPCAFEPEHPVDPELRRLTDRVRALTVLGDLPQARELLATADARLASVTTSSESSESGEQALVHAARAELAISEGHTQHAIDALRQAQTHALAAEFPAVLLDVWTVWAKLLMLDPQATSHDAELALVRIEQAEPLLIALHVDDIDIRRADLLEARGMAMRARGRPQQAIALHREAQALFVAAGRPTLASRSLVNIGANFQDLDEPEQARAAYDEALALLDAAKLPASYRSRVLLHRNLGLLAYASSDEAVLASGLPHFEFVLAHGNDDDRFEMHELILALALELDDDALTRSWAERALAALTARGEATAAEAFRIQRVAGFALAYLGDPRGEPLLLDAERSSATLPPDMQLNLQMSWAEWLESVGRCDDAQARRDRVAQLGAAADGKLAAELAEWQASGPTADCATTNSSKRH